MNMGFEQTFAKLVLAGALAASVGACGTEEGGAYDADLKINEVMSKNAGAVLDASDGSYPDWIEIYNRGDKAVDLKGFKLGDDKKEWSLPDGVGSIEPKGFLMFWADSSPDLGPLHLPFKFSGSGDSATLSDPNGNVIDSVKIPASGDNQAFARFPDGADGPLVMCPNFTPGRTNWSSCEESKAKDPAPIDSTQ
jgi:hypothetical protein